MQPPSDTTILRLDDLLKLAGVVDSGGQAKALIQGGKVVVNGEVDTRRGRKLVLTDQVLVGGRALSVEAVLKLKAPEPERPARRKDTPFDAPVKSARGEAGARPPRAKGPRRKPRNGRRP